MPQANKLKNNTTEIIDRYKLGETTVDLSKIFNCSDAAIWYLLRRNNVKTRDRSHSARKYTANYKFFDVIDTPEKAYVLGYFYADGSNHISTNRLLFTSVDTDVLEKVLHVMESDAPLELVSQNTVGNIINGGKKIKTNKKKYTIRISSKYMCKSLEKLGGTQIKTYTLEFPTPDIVPGNLIRHMIRGYMDGDGYVYSCKSKYKPPLSVGFCGTIGIVSGINNYFNNSIGISGIIRSKGKIYEVNYHGYNKSSNVLSHIYENSTIHMNRKFKKYHDIIKARNDYDKQK